MLMLLLLACRAPAPEPKADDTASDTDAPDTALDTDPADTDSAADTDPGDTDSAGDTDDSDPPWDTGPAPEIPPGTFALAGAYHLDAADLVYEGDEVGDATGWALAVVPDLDRDGVSELLVAAYARDAAAGAWLLPGDAAGLRSVTDGTLLTDGTPYLGDDVAVGDRDGDGRPDLAVSGTSGDLVVAVAEAPVAGPTFDLAGAALRVHRDAGAADGAGSALAFGDLDGDGQDELLVGAGDDGGGVYVLAGGRSGDLALDADADAFWAAEDPNDRAGFDLTTLGDVDGDGYEDALVGAFWARTTAGPRYGRAYLVRGPATGLGSLTDADARLDGEGGNYFGRCVAAVPDVDGDDLPDLAVAGKVYASLVYSGTVRGDVGEDEALGVLHHYQEGEYISGPCALAGGDANGDGVGDVLVGFGPAYGDPAGGAGAGTSFLYLGPFDGWREPEAADARFAGWDERDMAGWAVALGDVDGDTLDDVVIGALRTWSFAAGRVAVVLSGAAHAPPPAGRFVEGDVTPALTVTGGFDDGGGPAALDLDGDGAPELAVSAPGAYTDVDGDAIPLTRGAVRFLAPATATSADDAVATLWGDEADPLARLVFAPLGDLDGDGAPDLVVADSGRSVVTLVDGPYAADGTLAAAARATWTEPDRDSAGYALALGDPDGDGVPALYVGAPGYGPAAVYRLPLAAEGARALADADLVVTEAEASDAAGVALLGDADLDGDGLDDLVVGAWRGAGDLGAVYVLSAPPDGAASLLDADLALVGPFADARAGRALAAADLDGDGALDLAVGVPSQGAVPGEVLGLRGPLAPTASLAAPDFVVAGRHDGQQTGAFLVTLDADGDGQADLGVGGSGDAPEVAVVPGPFAGTVVPGDRGTLFLPRHRSVVTALASPGDLDGDGRDDLAVVADTLFLWSGGGL